MFKVNLTIEAKSDDESEISIQDFIDELTTEIEGLTVYVNFEGEEDEDGETSEEEAAFDLTVRDPKEVI